MSNLLYSKERKENLNSLADEYDKIFSDFSECWASNKRKYVIELLSFHPNQVMKYIDANAIYENQYKENIEDALKNYIQSTSCEENWIKNLVNASIDNKSFAKKLISYNQKLLIRFVPNKFLIENFDDNDIKAGIKEYICSDSCDESWLKNLIKEIKTKANAKQLIDELARYNLECVSEFLKDNQGNNQSSNSDIKKETFVLAKKIEGIKEEISIKCDQSSVNNNKHQEKQENDLLSNSEFEKDDDKKRQKNNNETNQERRIENIDNKSSKTEHDHSFLFSNDNEDEKCDKNNISEDSRDNHKEEINENGEEYQKDHKNSVLDNQNKKSLTLSDSNMSKESNSGKNNTENNFGESNNSNKTNDNKNVEEEAMDTNQNNFGKTIEKNLKRQLEEEDGYSENNNEEKKNGGRDDYKEEINKSVEEYREDLDNKNEENLNSPDGNVSKKDNSEENYIKINLGERKNSNNPNANKSVKEEIININQNSFGKTLENNFKKHLEEQDDYSENNSKEEKNEVKDDYKEGKNKTQVVNTKNIVENSVLDNQNKENLNKSDSNMLKQNTNRKNGNFIEGDANNNLNDNKNIEEQKNLLGNELNMNITQQNQEFKLELTLSNNNTIILSPNSCQTAIAELRKCPDLCYQICLIKEAIEQQKGPQASECWKQLYAKLTWGESIKVTFYSWFMFRIVKWWRGSENMEIKSTMPTQSDTNLSKINRDDNKFSIPKSKEKTFGI